MGSDTPGRVPPPEPGDVDQVRAVGFKRGDVEPAAIAYVDRDDQILVLVNNAVASAIVNVTMRWQDENGRVLTQQWPIIPTSARATTSTILQLGEGYILGVGVNVSGANVRRGQCFVQVIVSRGGNTVAFAAQVLVADYVSTGAAIGSPGGRQLQGVDGPGMLRSVTGTNPAAGSEVTETVPTGARWKLRSFRVQLVTAVAAATRRVHLIIDDGATILQDLAAADTEIASLTRNYNFLPEGFQRAAQDNEIYVPLPVEVVMFQGWRIRTLTTNLQGADDFGAPQYEVEEWMEP